GPRRPHDRGEATLREGHGHAVERVDGGLALAVAPPQLDGADELARCGMVEPGGGHAPRQVTEAVSGRRSGCYLVGHASIVRVRQAPSEAKTTSHTAVT